MGLLRAFLGDDIKFIEIEYKMRKICLVEVRRKIGNNWNIISNEVC